VRAAVNELIPAKYRATALSATSLVDGLVSGGGLLILGALVRHVSDVSVTWPATGAALALVGVALGIAVGSDHKPATVEEIEVLEEDEETIEDRT
jgi:hypothetical protein